jgi:hypothetical protein
MRAKANGEVVAIHDKILDVGRARPARAVGRQVPAISTVLTMHEMYSFLSDREQRSVDDLVRVLWQRHR